MSEFNLKYITKLWAIFAITGSCRLQSATSTYNWQLPLVTKYWNLKLATATYNWKTFFYVCIHIIYTEKRFLQLPGTLKIGLPGNENKIN